MRRRVTFSRNLTLSLSRTCVSHCKYCAYATHRPHLHEPDDLGGTLMQEPISRMAGSRHGVRLDPADLIGAAHAAGRPAAERYTLYGIRRRYDLSVAA